MNRREFLAAGITTTTLATRASAGLTFSAAQRPQPAFGFDSPPVLQNPTADGVTVAWAVNGPATGWVEYGPTRELGRRADMATSGLLPYESRFLSVRVTGLTPGQPVFYRPVAMPIDFAGPYRIRRGEPVAGDVRRYTPPAPDADEASFAVLNDTHEKTPVLAALTAALAKSPADFTIWNGDVFDDVNGDEQIVANVLRPAGAAYAAERPVLFVPGNHDHRGVLARGLARAFTPWPNEPDCPRCFAVRHGPLAIVALDTGEDKPDRHPAWAGLAAFEPYRARQRDWLERTLKQPEVASAPFLVVFCHIPLFGHPGENGGDTMKGFGSWQKHASDLWHPVLARSGAQLVVCGHTHRHRFDPPADGRPYAQLVGGGPSLQEATLLRGRATAGELTVTAERLDGRELGRWTFAPRPLR